MKRWVSALLVTSIAVNIFIFASCGYLVFKRGGIPYLTARVLAGAKFSEQPPNYENKQEAYKMLSIDKKTDIVFLGDSLTDNCEWAEFLGNFRVVNRGISRDTTEGILNRLQTITDTQPRKLFIMVGINDLYYGRSQLNILNTYSRIIDTVKEQSPETKIYIQSILPISSKNAIKKKQINNDIMVLNESLRNLGETYNVEYIDLHSAFLLNNEINPEYTTDGIHLTVGGYMLWRDIIQNYI